MTANGWTTLSSPEGRPAEDAGVGDQASAPADLHLRADDAVGADLHVVGDLRAGVDAGRIGNQGRHDRWVPPDRFREGAARGRPVGRRRRSRPASAPASIRPAARAIADGLRIAAGRVPRVDDHEPDPGLGRRQPPTLAVPVTTAGVVLDPVADDLEHDLVAGDDRPAELDPVDRGDQGQLPLAAELAAISTPAACARASTTSTPGMIGIPGQWPAEEGLVDAHVLDPHHALAAGPARAPGRPAGTGSDAAAGS